MRYPPDQKEKTRRRILEAASVVFRGQGFQGAGVDAVMAEAGLTAGGFYSHFDSKDALFAEAFAETLRQARTIRGKEDEHLAGPDRIRAIAGKYLSLAHCRMADQGCPMPPLLAELSRQDEPARRGFQEVLTEIADSLEPHVAADESARRADQGFAVLATMIGGITLARAVADESLSDRILAACREQIEMLLRAAAPTKGRKEKPKSASSSPERKRKK